MRVFTTPDAQLRLSDALGHMEKALTILDELDAPGEIGSTLDHAIMRLRDAFPNGVGQSKSSVQMLMEQLERELLAEPRTAEPGPNPWEVQPI